MTAHRWLAASLIIFTVAKPVRALDPSKQITQYVHESWGLQDGLPQLTISAIAQTADGYLWLATQEGLVRFDGVRFKTFTRRDVPELVDNFVRALLVDRHGILWIGTSASLVKLENGRFTRVTREQGFDLDTVSCLYEDPDGSIWVGSPGKGLAHFASGEWSTYRKANGLASDFVWAVRRDRAGVLWIGTREGLARLADGTFSTLTTRDGLTDNRVVAFHESPDGTLWIGAYGGLNRLKDGRLASYATAQGLSGDVVFDVKPDADGNLWIATFGGGVNRMRGDRFDALTAKQGLSDDLIRALYVDREGSLWIGTTSGGLHRLRDGAVTTLGVAEGLSEDNVASVLEDRTGRLWVGTHGGGLTAVDRAGRSPQVFGARDGLMDSNIYALHEDRRGVIWVSTQRNGVFRLEHGMFRPFRDTQLGSAESVTAMADDRQGDIWFGTYGGGLKRLHAGALATFGRAEGLPGNFIWSLLDDADGTLWIGTENGLAARTADGRITVFGAGEGLIAGQIICLHRDSVGTLWACSSDGLYRFDGHRFFHYTGVASLADQIYQVLDDGRGELWISTTAGIVRVRREALEAVAAGRANTAPTQLYLEADGMRSRECNGSTHPAGWKTRDGRLMFPTVKGVAIVDPQRLPHNALPPPVIIETVTAGGIERNGPWPPEGLAFEPGAGTLEWHYVGLSLAIPDKMQFKYRLEGFDRGWVDAGSRRAAYYTNIPPGEYRFRVIASNNDGVWNETGASVPVRLDAHFYQTIWFRALTLVPIALVAWGLHRVRLSRALAMERMRTEIATDLHDDVGASLSQIAVLSEVARAQGQGGRAAEPLARIAEVARESVDSMSDIVWALDPQKDRAVDLATRMRRFAGDTLGARNIDVDFQVEGGTDAHLEPRTRRELMLMFKEIVNNIVRHARATRVEVSLRVEGRRIVLAVADDGRGFDRGAAPGDGQGLKSLERRAARLGATIEIASRPGAGTTIVVASG